MSRIKTIPAVAERTETQRVKKIHIDYANEVIHVSYETVDTGDIEVITLPTSTFDTIVTALNPDRLWTYIDNNS